MEYVDVGEGKVIGVESGQADGVYRGKDGDGTKGERRH